MDQKKIVEKQNINEIEQTKIQTPPSTQTLVG